jgi:hypothetical protein
VLAVASCPLIEVRLPDQDQGSRQQVLIFKPDALPLCWKYVDDGEQQFYCIFCNCISSNFKLFLAGKKRMFLSLSL